MSTNLTSHVNPGQADAAVVGNENKNNIENGDNRLSEHDNTW